MSYFLVYEFLGVFVYIRVSFVEKTCFFVGVVEPCVCLTEHGIGV